MITSSSSAIRQQSKKIDTIIKGFITEYELTQTPIEVSFRALLPELRTERFTHLIHTYPAKLLVHIPYFFLNNTIFSKPGDTVLDPFCGTGTVLLEALLAGRNALGADANPLARLIAEVKTVRCSDARLKKTLELILKIKDCDGIVPVPSVVNIDYWFNPNNKSSLSHILQSINEVQDQHLKNFFL
ncbi:MAG TPA: DNA methyltransferase, partial [Pedobacter sp.]